MGSLALTGSIGCQFLWIRVSEKFEIEGEAGRERLDESGSLKFVHKFEWAVRAFCPRGGHGLGLDQTVSQPAHTLQAIWVRRTIRNECQQGT